MQTPCIGVCRMDERADICVGCGRTRLEIASWATLTDAEREWYMTEAEQRLNNTFNGWVKDA